MKQIPVSLLTLTAGIVITLLSIWAGQNNGLLPEQASAQAPLVDGLFNVMFGIATALFLVVEGAIVVFMIKYRRRAGDDSDGIPVEGNLPLEAFWTAIPAVLVIGIGLYSVDVFRDMGGLDPGSHSLMSHQHNAAAIVAQSPTTAPVAGDTLPLLAEGSQVNLPEPKVRAGIGASPAESGKQPDLSVNVTGIQFAWLFNYPDSGITTGELHVPVGKDVRLNLTGQDVIHSFWVPQFRLKQDAIPGQKTELRFIATKVGTYPVVCAELCGSYHGGMRTQVVVHTPEAYEQWVNDNRVAQASPQQVVAVKPANLSEPEYLTPYGDEIGVTPEALHQLHLH